MDETYRLRARLDLRSTLDSFTADEILATVALLPADIPVLIDLHELVAAGDAALDDLARALTLAGRPVLFQGLPAHLDPLPAYTLPESLADRN